MLQELTFVIASSGKTFRPCPGIPVKTGDFAQLIKTFNPHIAQIHTLFYTPRFPGIAAGITAITQIAFYRIIQ